MGFGGNSGCTEEVTGGTSVNPGDFEVTFLTQEMLAHMQS
jgi:hypothetical protein